MLLQTDVDKLLNTFTNCEKIRSSLRKLPLKC